MRWLIVILLVTGCGTYDHALEVRDRLLHGGHDGTDGVDGKDGLSGVDGNDGSAGVDGQDGADGARGEDGVDGQVGPAGAAGADGGSCSVREEQRGRNTFTIIECDDGSSVEWKQ